MKLFVSVFVATSIATTQCLAAACLEKACDHSRSYVKGTCRKGFGGSGEYQCVFSTATCIRDASGCYSCPGVISMTKLLSATSVAAWPPDQQRRSTCTALFAVSNENERTIVFASALLFMSTANAERRLCCLTLFLLLAPFAQRTRLMFAGPLPGPTRWLAGTAQRPNRAWRNRLR
jgi:hypothetical protein